MNATRYVAKWLKDANKKLAKDPSNDLEAYTAFNFMGGCAWDTWISQVYNYPQSPKDYHQRGDVHQILQIAFKNLVERAERLPPQKWNAATCRDVCEAYRLACMMSQTDPVSVVQMKIRLNRLCTKFCIDLALLMNDPEMRMTTIELAFLLRSKDFDDEPFNLGFAKAEV